MPCLKIKVFNDTLTNGIVSFEQLGQDEAQTTNATYEATALEGSAQKTF